VTRTADETRRVELLDRIVDYATSTGIAELSLRPLAKAVGSSPRVLLYYFGSKDELIVAVMTRARARQAAVMANVKLTGLSPNEACRLCWNIMSDARNEPLYRLFYEVYTIALRHPSRFPGFLERAVGDWLAFIAGPAMAAGVPREPAYAYATMVLAGFRGFLLDLMATRDRARVDAAVAMWLELINVPASTTELQKDSDIA
jgi:AcrR family transcriptional regulator